MEVELLVYNQNFHDLDQINMAQIIVMLLDILPTVKEMRSYIMKQRIKDKALQDWVEKISPAGLGILRWIIASNRSCIVQVDKTPGQTEKDAIESGVRFDPKIPGMDQWIQFRFAQGAPDKEFRFLKCLRDSQKKNDLKHPTIFAWHGSKLSNWHSIIRNGLDFKNVVNGRAFGHGCYHSQNLHTSLGYCQEHRVSKRSSN